MSGSGSSHRQQNRRGKNTERAKLDYAEMSPTVTHARSRSWMASVAVTVLLAGALPAPPAVGLPPPPQRLTPFRIPAAADFSSTVRGYFWDFSDPLHYGSADSRRGWDERLEDGWFIATSTLINPTVRLNSLNIPGTVPVPNEHADTPLNPSYRFVTMRMCSDRSTSAMVFWHRNASFEDGDLGATNFQSVRTGCHIY